MVCAHAFSSNCDAWYCANLDSLNGNVVIFMAWDACVCKCCVVTNAAGTPGLLDELHKEMWLLFKVVQILKGGGGAQKLQAVFLEPKCCMLCSALSRF